MKVFINILFALLSFSTFGQKQDTIMIDEIKVVGNFDKSDTIIVLNNGMGTGKDTFVYFAIIDTSFEKYKLPKTFIKPKNWKKAEESRGKFEYYGGSYSDTFSIDNALSIIDTVKDFSMLMSAKSWCLNNYKEVFPYLIARLTNKTKVGLENTADLIIWDRFETGDLKFYGHGGGMQEDIFTISGRVSWILNEITGEEFAVVHGNLSQEQAVLFKTKWVEYINGLKEKRP